MVGCICRSLEQAGCSWECGWGFWLQEGVLVVAMESWGGRSVPHLLPVRFLTSKMLLKYNTQRLIPLPEPGAPSP